MQFALKQVNIILRDDEREFGLRVKDLIINSGDKIAIVGPSGCGKTTLLRIIALLQSSSSPDSLRFQVNLSHQSSGIDDISRLWQQRLYARLREIRAKYIGYLASEGGLYPSMSILENAKLRLEIAGGNDANVTQACSRLARSLDMSPGLLNSPLDKLSRGQRIRGAMIQTYIHQPVLVVADEPTSALHPALAETAMKFMIGHVEQNNKVNALVIATHDIVLARQLGFKILIGQYSQHGNQITTEFIPE